MYEQHHIKIREYLICSYEFVNVTVGMAVTTAIPTRTANLLHPYFHTNCTLTNFWSANAASVHCQHGRSATSVHGYFQERMYYKL